MVMGMNYFVGIGLFLKNKMHLFLIPSLAAVVLNIIMNYFFIPLWGMDGCSLFNINLPDHLYSNSHSYFRDTIKDRIRVV